MARFTLRELKSIERDYVKTGRNYAGEKVTAAELRNLREGIKERKKEANKRKRKIAKNRTNRKSAKPRNIINDGFW